MIIMGCRYIFLQKLIAALDKIQIPLVGFDGTKFIPFLNYDDIGLYIFVPKIVHFFQVSLDRAIDLFFYTQLAVAFILAIIGFLLLFKSFTSIVFSLVYFALFLRFTYYSVFDVYVEYFLSTLSIIPLFLYFIFRNSESRMFNYFMVFSGMIIAFSHYVRSYSSLPVIGFIVCMIFLNQKLVPLKKVALLSCMFLGIGIPVTYFKITVHQYQNFAKKNFPEFDHLQTKHVFWHPVYLGFGLLKIYNKDDITYDDAFGEKKVQEKMSHISLVQTAEYENILKNEVFELIKHQRWFVLWTIFAKLGILFLYLLLFANLGLVTFFCFYRRRDLDISFLCAFALSSITPLLTLPYYCYTLSFISCAFIFGLFYIQQFLEQLNLKAYVSKIINKKKLFDYQLNIR